MLEGDRQRSQRGVADPGGQQEEQGPLELGIREQRVEIGCPAALELHARADLVEHLDAGRQARFHGVLGEEPLRE